MDLLMVVYDKSIKSFLSINLSKKMEPVHPGVQLPDAKLHLSSINNWTIIDALYARNITV